jgi:hypothetical protein
MPELEYNKTKHHQSPNLVAYTLAFDGTPIGYVWPDPLGNWWHAAVEPKGMPLRQIYRFGTPDLSFTSKGEAGQAVLEASSWTNMQWSTYELARGTTKVYDELELMLAKVKKASDIITETRKVSYAPDSVTQLKNELYVLGARVKDLLDKAKVEKDKACLKS